MRDGLDDADCSQTAEFILLNLEEAQPGFVFAQRVHAPGLVKINVILRFGDDCVNELFDLGVDVAVGGDNNVETRAGATSSPPSSPPPLIWKTTEPFAFQSRPW